MQISATKTFHHCQRCTPKLLKTFEILAAMKIGFIINKLETERHGFTTTQLAMQATNMGHQAWVISVGDLAYDPDECIRARARMAPGGITNHFKPTLRNCKAHDQK